MDALVDHDSLQTFSRSVIEGMGAQPQVAAEVARHLVGANLSGHDSHGVLRLTQYVGELDRGLLVPDAETVLARSVGVTALFDGNRGFGHWSTMLATRWAMDRARESGLAAAAIRHANHIGRLGEYSETMAGGGLVGLVTYGVAGAGGSTVAPFGGTTPFLGTNPWSVAVPAASRPPMLFDAATSTIAQGKIRVALAKHAPLPEGTLLDPGGEPTLDPTQLAAGGVLTVLGGGVAGHKGYGLSMAAALVGGLAMIGDLDPTPPVRGRGPGADSPRSAGVFVMAVDPAAFGDPDAYQRQVAAVLEAVVRVPPAPGFDRVLVPGEPEQTSRAARLREGIPLPSSTWDDLAAIAERFDVALPARR